MPRQIKKLTNLIRIEENKNLSLENKEIVNNHDNKIVIIKEVSKGSNNSDKDLKGRYNILFTK